MLLHIPVSPNCILFVTYCQSADYILLSIHWPYLVCCICLFTIMCCRPVIDHILYVTHGSPITASCMLHIAVPITISCILLVSPKIMLCTLIYLSTDHNLYVEYVSSLGCVLYVLHVSSLAVGCCCMLVLWLYVLYVNSLAMFYISLFWL